MGKGDGRQKNIGRILSAALILVNLGWVVQSRADAEYISPEKATITRLKNAGVPDTFIDKLRLAFEPEGRDRLIELMSLGFLLKADYSGHYSPQAIQACKDLIRKFPTVFIRAENEYGVPRELIAALMWVETRHGKNTGTFNPMNAFYSVMMGEHPDTHPELMVRLKKRLGQEPDLAMVQKATQRTKDKADWALEQIQALVTIDQKYPGMIDGLKTSYAGAFGFPQFLPSSYLKWAISGAKESGQRPDLFTMRDAILSVANYLKTNGWQTESFEARKAALFHYNRSEDYGNIIQKIARSVRPEGDLARAPAGQSTVEPQLKPTRIKKRLRR